MDDEDRKKLQDKLKGLKKNKGRKSKDMLEDLDSVLVKMPDFIKDVLEGSKAMDDFKPFKSIVQATDYLEKGLKDIEESGSFEEGDYVQLREGSTNYKYPKASENQIAKCVRRFDPVIIPERETTVDAEIAVALRKGVPVMFYLIDSRQYTKAKPPKSGINPFTKK